MDGGCIWQLYSRDRNKVTTAFGGALQELDRLIARPSIEYKIEAENKVKVRIDNNSGD
jgi:hypothetical protein